MNGTLVLNLYKNLRSSASYAKREDDHDMAPATIRLPVPLTRLMVIIIVLPADLWSLKCPPNTHTHHLGSAGQMWNLVDFLKKAQTHLLIVTFKSGSSFSPSGVGGRRRRVGRLGDPVGF